MGNAGGVSTKEGMLGEMLEGMLEGMLGEMLEGVPERMVEGMWERMVEFATQTATKSQRLRAQLHWARRRGANGPATITIVRIEITDACEECWEECQS